MGSKCVHFHLFKDAACKPPTGVGASAAPGHGASPGGQQLRGVASGNGLGPVYLGVWLSRGHVAGTTCSGGHALLISDIKGLVCGV